MRGPYPAFQKVLYFFFLHSRSISTVAACGRACNAKIKSKSEDPHTFPLFNFQKFLPSSALGSFSSSS